MNRPQLNAFDKNNMTLFVIISGLMGCLFSIAIMCFESFCGQNPFIVSENMSIQTFYNCNPRFVVWFFFVMLETTVWFSFLIPVTFLLFKLWPDRKTESGFLFFSGIITVIFFIIIYIKTYYIENKYFTPPSHLDFSIFPLNHGGIKMDILIYTGLTIAYLSVLGILFVYNAMKSVVKVWQYEELRKILAFFFTSLSIEIGLATLATASLQQAVSLTYNDFPIEVAYAYGLFFSLLIAVVYLPVYIQSINLGKSLVNDILPFPDRNPAKWEIYLKEKDILENKMMLKQDWKEITQIVFTIAGPLIGSFIPGLLDK